MKWNLYSLNAIEFAKIVLNAVTEPAVLLRKFASKLFVSSL